MSTGKRWMFRLASAALAMAVLLVLAELIIARVAPQACMSPRYMFSPHYGMLPFPNTAMTHWQPGVFRYVYTTNDKHHRGILPPVSNRYVKKNIVVLGDSNSFGMGVRDGQEYASLLDGILEDTHDVVNLSSPGWGLTQQIRRYYELARLYDPAVVVLQFCNNDVEDNLANAVTEIEDGRFLFVDSPNTVNWVKKYLSRAPIQRTQVYNLVRNSAYEFFTRGVVRKKEEHLEQQQSPRPGVEAAEQFYMDLLELFTRELAEHKVRFLFLSYEDYLAMFPALSECVETLQKEGGLERVSPDPWLQGLPDAASPEGHRWGAKGHQTVAEHLAELIRETT